MLYEDFIRYKAEKNKEITEQMKLPMEDNIEENNLVSDSFVYDNLENFGKFLQIMTDNKQDRPIAVEFYEMQKRICRLETELECLR